MQPEIFKPVITSKADYTGFYEVSNYGRVKSLSRKESRIERILKPQINDNGKGYYVVTLHKNGKREDCIVHLIEWDAHSKIKRNGYEVDHIDEDKLNNYIGNFQLLTKRQNISKSRLLSGKKSSQFTGVCWYKRDKKWSAEIRINGKKKHLGVFKNEYEAHLCYQKALNNL